MSLDGHNGWLIWKLFGNENWVDCMINKIFYIKLCSYDNLYPFKTALNKPEIMFNRDYIKIENLQTGNRIPGQFGYYSQFYVENQAMIKESYWVFFPDIDQNTKN